MLKRYLPFVMLFSVVVSCTKDKANTKPLLKFKNINGSEFFPGSTVNITLTYTDKEGDLGNGVLTYIRNRTNVKPIANSSSNDLIDTVNSQLPEFPNTKTGELNVLIPYAFLDEDPLPSTAYDSLHPNPFNDSSVFKIFVTDAQGNKSDTIITPQIVQRPFH
jgi:hypothetical protein